MIAWRSLLSLGRLLGGLSVVAVLAAAWCAILWWWIAPDFKAWSIAQLIAVHVVPPLLAWFVWLYGRKYRRDRLAAVAAGRETALAKDRQEKLEAARRVHGAELQRLHFACDCRALALTYVIVAEEGEEPLVPDGDGVYFNTYDTDVPLDTDVDDTSTLAHLRPGIEEALDTIYGRCPAATAFPIYCVMPPDAFGEQVMTTLREIQAKSIAELGLPPRPLSEFGRVLLLPASVSVADSLIGLFESSPDLPGAVVVAFDSPWWRHQLAQEQVYDDESESALKVERRKWIGQPGQGVFALLVTHPQLSEMLAGLPRATRSHDVMTPYWEKDLAKAARYALLAGLPDDERDGLEQCAPLARIHRAIAAPITGSGASRRPSTQSIGALVERAQIQAGLIDLPFDSPEGEDAAKTPAPSESRDDKAAHECRWLVHNAGGVDRSGKRLAALSLALVERGLDVDPIEMATNLVVRAGDFGQARGVGLLAVTVARAASGDGPVLCAEFGSDDSLALFFVTPAEDAA